MSKRTILTPLVFALAQAFVSGGVQAQAGAAPLPSRDAMPSPAQPRATTVAVLRLEQVLQAALAHPDVAASREAVAAGLGDVQAADRSPFPVLTGKFSQMDLQNGTGPGTLLGDKRIDKSLGLDWTWERGDKRSLRARLAQQTVQALRSDVDETEFQQRAAAYAAFYDLLAAQERLLQVSAMADSATQLATSARRRVQAGDLAEQDAARSAIEAQRATADMQSAQLDRQRAALTLDALTGLGVGSDAVRLADQWPGVASLDTALNPAPLTPEGLQAMVDTRPDVLAARGRLDAAQAALDVATAQKKADITWGASLDHYPGTSTRLLELRMQMPLQWSYDQRGEVARAQAQMNQARLLLERTTKLAGNEYLRLWQEMRTAAQRFKSYSEHILPQAQKVAGQAELAYSKGALSLTDLLDARRTLRATALEFVSARSDHAKAVGTWMLRTKADVQSLFQ